MISQNLFFKTTLVIIIFINAISCDNNLIKENPYELEIISEISDYKELVLTNPDKELIDLEKFIPDIVLDIRYAGKNNFTGEIIYKAAKAYLRKPAAIALLNVQNELKTRGLEIKVFDAYRPYAATVKFYQVYPDTIFVAAPWRGSVHNRACAVDLTLIDIRTGDEFEMPTPFDDFTKKASHDYMDLSEKVINNRKILHDIMVKHGFTIYKNEWWHYDFKDFKSFELMNIYFEELD